MYLSSTTESLEMVLAGAISVSNPMYIISYNDMTSVGMTLPQSSTQGLLNGITSVQVLAPPLAATNRQVYNLTLYNNDNREVIVTVRKDVSGTKYNIIKSSLAPGATLMWSRESGWKILNGEKEGASTISREYTANATWVKPAALRAAMIVCVGAGGGGGSGRLDIAGTTRGGGGGGGGGAMTRLLLLEKDLPPSVSVVVGIGGTGGAGVTVNPSNGNNGSPGTATYFGNILNASYGGGGIGGSSITVNGGTGGSITNCTYGCSLIALQGSSGAQGGGGGNVAAGALNGAGTTAAAPGGAGGGGITIGNVAATANLAGGSVYNNGALVAGPASGTNGTLSAATFLYLSTTIGSTIGIGTSGAGGNQANPNGTNGGYGAGGGGGFGQLGPGTSGAGGNGGGGICLVLEIY